jgi:hypothetical protein
LEAVYPGESGESGDTGWNPDTDSFFRFSCFRRPLSVTRRGNAAIRMNDKVA